MEDFSHSARIKGKIQAAKHGSFYVYFSHFQHFLIQQNSFNNVYKESLGIKILINMIKCDNSENGYFEVDFKYYSQETPKISIEKHKEELETISYWYDIWNKLHDVLESSYTDDDPFFLMNIETSANIEASIILSVNGFYRQAIALLRCWFENSMYGPQ